MRSLTRRADLSLYTAKAEGRDRVIGLPDIEVQDSSGVATSQERLRNDSCG